MSSRIIVSSNPDTLSGLAPDVTVEAEYGDRLVEGRVLTLAHHGARSASPAPCVAPIPDGIEVATIGCSHLDLDTLGGILRVMRRQPGPEAFWMLAAWVDVRGPHRATECPEATEELLAALHAWWAWSEEHRFLPPRDGSAADATAWVEEAAEALRRIFSGDEQLLAAGRELAARTERLSAESFVEAAGGVVVRVAPCFTNHLYRTPDGRCAAAVVAYNTTTGAITVSRESPEVAPGLDCRAVVQGLWGELAGGHSGIAGSPRGQRMRLSDLADAARAVREAMAGA